MSLARLPGCAFDQGHLPLRRTTSMVRCRLPAVKEMRAFRESNRAIMSNARWRPRAWTPRRRRRCIPIPRKSKVDIVQAAGRTMKADGKIRATSFFRCSLRRKRTRPSKRREHDFYFETWDVLQAMQRKHFAFGIIREMRRSEDVWADSTMANCGED